MSKANLQLKNTSFFKHYLPRNETSKFIQWDTGEWVFNLSHENITLKNYIPLRCNSFLLSREQRDERREERKNESGGQTRIGRREREKRKRKWSDKQGYIYETCKSYTKLKKIIKKKWNLPKLFYKTR